MRPQARERRKGVVLIFTICILPMLAILGVVFATSARVERNASASYLAGARARMLAISGVDFATVRLRSASDNHAWSGIREGWYCPDAAGTPIASLTTPSYNSNRKSFGVPYSFAAAGTYTSEGDIVTLRVSDCASRLYVNGAQASLASMLDTLGWAVAMVEGASAPADGWGARFLSARDAQPGRTIREENQLREVLRSVLSRDMADRMMPYLTFHAWVDAAVIAPRPPADGAASEAVPQLQPQRDAGGAVVGRAPVDVNTATVPVLACCLAGLAGEELSLAGRAWSWARTQPIKRDQALAIARLIDAYRQRVGDFHTWEEFFAFADGLATAGVLSQSQADVVKANANPSTLLNLVKPDREATLRVDKNSLTFSTTEFAFDAMGYFRIESLSRIFSKDGTEVASSRVLAEAKVYDVTRLSSQADFEAIRQGSVSPSVLSGPEQILARGGSIDRAKKPCALDGHLEPAPAPTAAGNGTLLYDLRNGVTNRARMGVFAPQVQGVTETASVFNTQGSRESDILCDGLCLDCLRKRIAAFPIDCLRSDKGDVKAGTVEYFVKWDRQASKAERIGFHGLDAKWKADSVPLVGTIYWISRHRLLGLCDPADPRNMAVYGNNGFNLTGGIKLGYYCNSDRPGTTSAFETGTWRHVAITWRDGFVTNIYLDGNRILGDDYSKGAKRGADTRERLLVGCDVDTTGGGAPIPRTAYFAEGTIDGVVATRGKKYSGDFTPPGRFDSRPATFRGSVPFVCERPQVVLRSVAFSAFVPRKDARGRALAPGMGPSVAVKVQTPGGAWVDVKDASETPVDSPGRGVMVGRVVAAGQRVPVEVTFTSTDTAATLNDLTLTYVDALKFLTFQID